ncbi:carboxymuconolactone decarboxylase family protein [Weizmannia acidilactici]|nr:carboxymuconolactone decarboxylase family protein [Weizmannia acidilactici]
MFKDGAVSSREKEILAVAVAHATECPYCTISIRKK